MKTTILTVFMMALTQIAQAGPFVSGGMPGALKCTDANKLYNVKIVYLGDDVELSGTQAGYGGQVPLKYSCDAVHEAVTTAIATELSFDCQSQKNEDSIQVYRNQQTQKTWAIAMTYTQNGIVKPTVLKCEKTSL